MRFPSMPRAPSQMLRALVGRSGSQSEVGTPGVGTPRRDRQGLPELLLVPGWLLGVG